MKGLKKYIDRYGYHFTESLSHDVSKHRWTSKDLIKRLENKVYYNVTESSLGDMLYIINACDDTKSGKEGIKYMLSIVEDFNYYGGKIFKEWLHQVEDFDFTPYI